LPARFAHNRPGAFRGIVLLPEEEQRAWQSFEADVDDVIGRTELDTVGFHRHKALKIGDLCPNDVRANHDKLALDLSKRSHSAPFML
jgi:hypothetical protein